MKRLKNIFLKLPILCKWFGWAIKLYYKRLWSKRSIKDYKNISIEITNKCNAKCKMCAHKDMTRPQETMSIERFTELIDKCQRKGIEKIYFGGLGEPLMDKELFKKIDLIVKKGLTLGSITTNGSLLTHERMKTLLSYDWEVFAISMDGATKRTYEEIRKLSYNIVKGNIRHLLRYRKARFIRTKIILQMTISQDNIHEKELFKKMWTPLMQKGDEFTFLYVTNYAGKGIDFGKRNIKIPCGRLWGDMLTVSSNGDLALCCWDYDSNQGLGNVFKEVTNRLSTIRQDHIEGNYRGLCKDCNDNYFLKPYYQVEVVK